MHRQAGSPWAGFFRFHHFRGCAIPEGFTGAPPPQPDWPAIRRAYCGGDGSVATICARFGVSVAQLYRRARKEGWPLRAPRSRPKLRARRGKQQRKPKPPHGSTEKGRIAHSASGPSLAAKPVNVGKPGLQALERRLGLIARLYHAIERKLRMIEERLATEAEPGALESERQARELGALIRSFEKLSEFEEQTRRALEKGEARARQSGDGARGGAESDAERWREEIARRIARLREAGPA